MALTTRLTSTVRSTLRLQEILTVLVRHGFDNVITETGIDQYFTNGRFLFWGKRKAKDTQRLPIAVRVRHVLEDLGPTYIKIGQILATRPDLIPQEWADEFKNLQDDCPKIPFEKIEEHLKEQFPGTLDRIFKYIDPKPLAAASMAQVHRATLADDTKVVIKVLRPGIRQTIRADMEVMHTLARLVEHYFQDLGYSPTGVVDEFSRELEREVDFLHEARSTDRLYGLFEDDPNVWFPKVYWDATTDSAMTLEEVQGTLLSRMDLKQLSKDQRRTLIQRGADAMFRQCFEFCVFHADPHPGNIFVLPDEKICFIDCGMTGRIEEHTAQLLADFVVGVVNGDLDHVLEVVAQLADVDPVKMEDRRLRLDAWDLVSRFQNASLETLDVTGLLNDFFDMLRRYKINCPADLVFLIKAITTIEGVGEFIDPTFNIVEFMEPHIRKLVAKRYSAKAISGRMRKSLSKYALLIETFPTELQKLFSQIKSNRMNVNLEHKGLDNLIDVVEHASRNVAYSLMVAALLVGSSILIFADNERGFTGHLHNIGMLGLIGSGVLTVMMVLLNRNFTKRFRK